METKKVSRKALKALLNDSLREAIGRLELPKANKKLDRILVKSSKKLADEFVDILKKESKKKKREQEGIELMKQAVEGKKKMKPKKQKMKVD